MKNVLMVAMALVMSSTVVTTAMAGDKPVALSAENAAIGEIKKLKAQEVKTVSWTGLVVTVDTAEKGIVAKNKKGEMSFNVSAAMFARGLRLEDLKTGDRIIVKYEAKDGRNMATGVAKTRAKRLIIASVDKKESAGEFIDDSVITTKVKAAILEEPLLKSLQINVKSYKGVVQLSGFVDSVEIVNRAGEVAGSIKGVKGVKNGLNVK